MQTVLMFYSRSVNCNAGSGADEVLAPADVGKFAELNLIPYWRRMLSNFYVKPSGDALFELDGRSWLSVEHYFHANKFKESHPEYYEEFTIESNSLLSQTAGAAIKKAGRKYKMTNENRIAWDQGKSADVLIRAQTAKFNQNPDLARVLRLTGDASLTHRPTSRSPLVVEYGLMNIRTALLNK